ncbi:MAG: family 20 glycosylhydrolase [Saprospiraceae bacterium]|nr:family 20 glycosylhydrolase [Saprospiraceae bacterium]
MRLLILSLTLLISTLGIAQPVRDSMPVRGLCIGAPGPDDVQTFADFIDDELARLGVNTLVLRVDFNFEYQSHPELRDDNYLSQDDVDLLKSVCAQHGIEIIPQINLLGHQSWHSKVTKLLEVYPQFDETPGVIMPDEYEWPNDDGLYCKSYCPLHPEVHEIVLALVDEIMDAFDATAFHAGMDEVFYIGDNKCPRCSGRDKAELFAGEVTKIRNHLAQSDRTLWIWGDRLIDGRTTGIGLWEASMNNTHRAIDMIPKDVVICDWHYERAEPTAAYFATKGFRVITCPWRRSSVALEQLEDWKRFQENANPVLAQNNLGMMQTIWSGASGFMEQFENAKEENNDNNLTGSVLCFKALFEAMNEE